MLVFAACAPSAKPTQPAAAGPLPARTFPTERQEDAGRARASSAPVAGWNKLESPPCRGVATTRSEDALTGEPRGALSLRSHRVRAVVSGGLSQTEVVEELVNEAARAVEARFSFVLPGGASVSGFSLLRGKNWLEAQLVDSDRIAAIPRGRDIEPFGRGSLARADGDDGDAFVARIVGFAPKQRRSLRLAYDGAVERSGSRELYRYPISLSSCASPPTLEVSIEVVLLGAPGTYDKIETPNHRSELRTEPDRVVVSFERRAVVPDQDFTVEFERRRESVEVLTDFAEPNGNPPPLGHVLMSLALPAVASGGPTSGGASTARVVLLDKSYSQSAASLSFQRRLVEYVLSRTTADERTSLLACDSACAVWSPDPVKTPDLAREAAKWLGTLTPGGTFDLEGALVHAELLLEPSERKQLVFLGNGHVSSGTLDRETLIARVGHRLARSAVDLRVFGVGPRQDEPLLFDLAAAARGTYSTLSDTVPIEHSAEELLASLRAPKLTDVTLELPAGMQNPAPARWPALVMGQTLRIAARAATSVVGSLRVLGKLEGHDYAVSYPVSVSKAGNDAEGRVARFWARERLREAARDVAGRGPEFGESELSRSAGVASRHTDWLLLEAGGHVRGVFPERSQAGLPAPSTFATQESRPSPRLEPRVRIGVSPATYRDGVDASSEHDARRQREVSRLVPILRRCYAHHAVTNGEWFEGRLGLMLRVGSRGSFESLAADAEPARDVRALVACVRAGAATLTYEPPASRTSEVRFSAELEISWSQGMIVRYGLPDAPVSQGALSTTITAGDEQWRNVSPRTERERRTRAVLDAQTPETPVSAALRGVEREPGSRAALDLLAAVAGAQDRSELLTAALEAQLALAPEQPELRRRLARAWLRAGDERRACAHLRALAPTLPAAASAAAFCRRRWLDGQVQGATAPATDEAANQLLEGSFDALAPDLSCRPFIVAVRCDSREPCPAPVVLTPEGDVISAFGRVPGPGKAEPLSFWPTTFGTYRILLLGGAPAARGTMELAVHMESRRFSFQRAGVSQTVASVELQPEPPEGLAIGVPLCGKRN